MYQVCSNEMKPKVKGSLLYMARIILYLELPIMSIDNIIRSFFPIP